MRNTITLQRIQRQIMEARPPDPARIVYEAITAATISPPISEEELRAILMTELGIVASVATEQSQSIKNLHFQNIYDFASWYATHQQEFNEAQKAALDTLLMTRHGIDSGCPCRRPSREHLANDYFGQFWTHNSRTDLLPTIARIANVPSVSVADICAYPFPI